jgi:Fur family peroxide stress response transcriptional regulator
MKRENSSSCEDRLEQMIDTLKKNNLRLTPQRHAILQVLACSDDHPSVDNIYQELVNHYPTMSLATVYKTIALLKAKGEVLELEFSEFNNRYDGNRPYPHPHLVCTGCGKILDQKPLDLAEVTKVLAEKTGFTINSHRLDFYGLCPACRKSK